MEIWTDCIGYEGLYFVSSYGNVKNNRGKLLKSYDCGRSYLYVKFRKNSVEKNHSVHRLVATAFLIKNSEFDVINHIDGNPTNNTLGNLEWCTQKYNVEVSTTHVSKTKCKKLYQYTLDGVLIAVYNSVRECSKITGYNNANIVQHCLGKKDKCYGYMWSYKIWT
jgi:hypothetical protein